MRFTMLNMKHFSRCALTGCARGAISPRHDVELAIKKGSRHRSFQDTEYLLTDRALRAAGLRENLRGLSVIVTGDNTIRTCLWRYKIKKRPGVLRRLQLIDAIVEQEMRREIRTFGGTA